MSSIKNRQDDFVPNYKNIRQLMTNEQAKRLIPDRKIPINLQRKINAWFDRKYKELKSTAVELKPDHIDLLFNIARKCAVQKGAMCRDATFAEILPIPLSMTKYLRKKYSDREAKDVVNKSVRDSKNFPFLFLDLMISGYVEVCQRMEVIGVEIRVTEKGVEAIKAIPPGIVMGGYGLDSKRLIEMIERSEGLCQEWIERKMRMHELSDPRLDLEDDV